MPAHFLNGPNNDLAESHPPSMNDQSVGHVTVLRHEAVSALNPKAGGVYIDGTFGGGGHTGLLLRHEPLVREVVAIDADLGAASRAAALTAMPGNRGRLRIVHRNFRELDSVLTELEVNVVDGVLLDLGLSSFQLDEAERGFSFRYDAPLDMRYDQRSGITAGRLVNQESEEELAHLIWTYGEERQSRRIASAIVRSRERSPILTTRQLASLVERTVGRRGNSPIHPATRTFQALRIEVNKELDALTEVLPAAVESLAPRGRLVVIAFHSLEDRIVKRFVEAEARTCVCPPEQPVCTCDTVPRLRRVGKPVRPGPAEISVNSRSRSAIMRVAERLDANGQVANRGNSQ